MKIFTRQVEYWGMSTRPPRVLTLLSGIGIGAVALAGCSTGQDVHHAATTPPPSAIPKPPKADAAQDADQDYLRLLRDGGWSVDDQAQIIRVAHAECANLGYGMSSADLIDKVIHQYRITGQAAVTQLIAAETVYCPQHLGH